MFVIHVFCQMQLCLDWFIRTFFFIIEIELINYSLWIGGIITSLLPWRINIGLVTFSIIYKLSNLSSIKWASSLKDRWLTKSFMVVNGHIKIRQHGLFKLKSMIINDTLLCKLRVPIRYSYQKLRDSSPCIPISWSGIDKYIEHHLLLFDLYF